MCTLHWMLRMSYNIYFDLFPASLSVDGGEDGVRQVAQTLQSCLELTEPVQQIQLVKKVCLV